MRYKLLIATFIVIFTGTHVAADAAISGVVVAVEADRMVIRQDNTGELVTVNFEKNNMRKPIAPGTPVTVGGKFRSDSTDIFDARKIKPRKKKLFKSDPTGVRKRLFKGKFPE
jgi:hypothetical protein